MATLNKLNRALDSLKKIVSQSTDDVQRQKLKAAPCLTITELVCKSNEKNMLLTFTVTSLIQLLEEADSSARLIIEESLNKIIRSSMDNSNHIAKILIALLKILGKNTTERCLKAALWRFAELSHFIRPNKGKIYVQTLIPVIVKMSERTEEGIHETLRNSLPSILRHIGLFTSDNDIKVLQKAFYKCLRSSSLEITRSAALNIVTVCRYSRKPIFFFSQALTILIDLLCNSSKFEKEDQNMIQGCLLCIRQILPYMANHVDSLKLEIEDKFLEFALQIYEICLIYADCYDHNIVTAALETLNQLLQLSFLPLLKKLSVSGGFSKSLLRKSDDHWSTVSVAAESDILSISSTIARTEDGFFSDFLREKNVLRRDSESISELSEQKQQATEDWVHEQSDQESDRISSSSLLNINASHFANSDDESSKDANSSFLFRTLSLDTIDKLNNSNESRTLNQRNGKMNSMKSTSVLSTGSIMSSLNNLTIVEIGDAVDSKAMPLNYCARFLVTKFLLNTANENSKHIRISVMSLALGGLAQLMKMYPRAAFLPVEKDGNVYENYSNLLQVILSHSKHEDQQIRGLVRTVVGSLISTSLMENSYLLIENDYHLLSKNILDELVMCLLQGVEDKSSVCIKLSLSGILTSLHPLMLTPEYKVSIPLLEALFALVHNPYWLIKNKLLEIFENISFELLYYAVGDNSLYQEKILRQILVLLGDADNRVRTAASQCVLKFVVNAYYPIDHHFELVCATYAKKLILKIPLLSKKNSEIEKPSIENCYCNAVERSLARIIHQLSEYMAKTSSKHVIAGCCEALSLLSAEFPPIKYVFSWQCFYLADVDYTSYSPCQLFKTSLHLMTRTSLILNFDVHLNLLRLNVQLFIALCDSNLKLKKSYGTATSEHSWSFLNDEQLRRLSESLLQHLVRLTNIFNDVVTEVTFKEPEPTDSENLILPLPMDQPLLLDRETIPRDIFNLKLLKRKRDITSEKKIYSFVQYVQDPLYLKLRSSLNSAYCNYQMTLKPESCEKFVSFLKTVLVSLSIALDFITISEVDRIAKNILVYLRNFMTHLPLASIHCVIQLLKCIFGTNAVAGYLQPCNERKNDLNFKNSVQRQLYSDCYQEPYEKIVKIINKSKKRTNLEMRNDWKLSQNEPNSSVVKQKRNTNVNILPSYIKLFEPNVILSLKQYTVTSDTELQAEILNLLSELIQLKVNYCLLDSEQVFIKFLLSQFQLIEEEQLLHIEKLLPAMFHFLKHLANEKHSKPVMSIPKVIQLCDSLFASLEAISHCTLAIDPVVRHVFLKSSVIANTAEIKELQTQRDVLFAMLLKQIHDPGSLELVTLVLKNSEEDQRLKRSSQVVQILLGALVECKIQNSINSSPELLNLFFTLHSASYNEQILLTSLFNLFYYNKDKNPRIWLPSFSALLLLIVTKYKENNLLFAVKEMLNHPVFNDSDDTDNNNGHEEKIIDPLHVANFKTINVSSENALAKLLCKVLTLIFKCVENIKFYGNVHDYVRSHEMIMLTEFLLIFSSIIRSGKFTIIKRELVHNSKDLDQENNWVFEITRASYVLLTTNPVVALRWYELLLNLRDTSTDLNWYFGQSGVKFNTYGISRNNYEEERQCLSNDVIKLGTFLFASDRKDEFFHDSEILKSFMENNFFILLNSLDEASVHYLLVNVQNSEKASNLVLDIIGNMLDQLMNGNGLENLLRCLEYTHESTKGKVLLLCCRSKFLFNSSISVSDRAFSLVTRTVDYLSTIEEKDLFQLQLKENELLSVLEELKMQEFPSNRSLLKSLQELVFKWFSRPVSSMRDSRCLNFDRIRSTIIDKEWFFNFVKKKCCDVNEMDYHKLSILLSNLPFEDIFTIMRSQNFNTKILASCFTVGTDLTLETWKPDFVEEHVEFSDLYLASRMALFRHIEHLKSLLPRTHQAYLPVKREVNRKEIQYSQRMDAVFSDTEFTRAVQTLMSAVEAYMKSVPKLASIVDLSLVIPAEWFREFSSFGALCLQMVHWFVKNHRHWSKQLVTSALSCCYSTFAINQILDEMSPSEICSIITSVFTIIENYTKEIIKIPSSSIIEELHENDSFSMYHSCHILSAITDYFIMKVPLFNYDSTSLSYFLREIVRILCQSEFAYNYVRIPLEVWRHIPKENIRIEKCITLSNLPESFLQDIDVLKNFVSRLMFFGWRSRLQFEECWMSLLIALNSLPEYESAEEEVEALSQINAITVSAVTSLLIQTMYNPIPGRKISPHVMHISRNSKAEIGNCRKRLKLAVVNKLLSMKMASENENLLFLPDNTNINIERMHNKHIYGFNQISVEYLSLCCNNEFSKEDSSFSTPQFLDLKNAHLQRENSWKQMGIDVNSCVYFLMDFYSRWLLKPQVRSIYVLVEIVNSMLVMSDLFNDLTQFSWLLESAIILWKKYSKENDTIYSYLIVIICKAASVSIPLDSDSKKFVMRILKAGLTHKQGSVQNASLHGLLYLLEKLFKKDILNQKETVRGEFEEEILSAAIFHVLTNLNVDMLETSNFRYEKGTTDCLISVAFYLIENNACGDNSGLLIDRLLKLSVRACKLSIWEVHTSIIQGFYNLMMMDNPCIRRYDTELSQLVKEILSTVECRIFASILSLQMLTTLMYISGDFEDTRMSESNETFDTEKLVARIEKISVFFNRIKKGSQKEAEIICTILPQILNDFFPPSEILNKVILEFLSPHQPYPELMAEVVFRVFQDSIRHSQLTLIQDWVLSLLNNFRNYPEPKAIFYLTCFFISACSSQWLTTCFPSITSRNMEITYDDRKLLCLSAAHFYSQLSSKSQKESFVSTFQQVENVCLDNSFSSIFRTVI